MHLFQEVSNEPEIDFSASGQWVSEPVVFAGQPTRDDHSRRGRHNINQSFKVTTMNVNEERGKGWTLISGEKEKMGTEEKKGMDAEIGEQESKARYVVRRLMKNYQ